MSGNENRALDLLARLRGPLERLILRQLVADREQTISKSD